MSVLHVFLVFLLLYKGNSNSHDLYTSSQTSMSLEHTVTHSLVSKDEFFPWNDGIS